MGSADRPSVQKKIVSAMVPKSRDPCGPHWSCDLHHESPVLRVTHTIILKNRRGHAWPPGRAAVHQPALLKKKGQFVLQPCRPKKGTWLVPGQPHVCCSVGVTLK
ncbi:hypothetical protein MRX96_024940 [Rhipicephalus microplus]